jgi:hypothetical protein
MNRLQTTIRILSKLDFFEIGPILFAAELSKETRLQELRRILKKYIISCNLVFNLSNGVTDTLESSSILIFFIEVKGIYTQSSGGKPV